MMAHISLLSNVRLAGLMDSGMMAHISLLSSVRLTGLMDSGMMAHISLLSNVRLTGLKPLKLNGFRDDGSHVSVIQC